MRVIVLPDEDSVAERAAKLIASEINRASQGYRPRLGLATGSTPLPTYQKLVKAYESGDLSFRRVVTFNLDEYVGLPSEHPQSYATFMHEHLFAHVDIMPSNCHLPLGDLPLREQELNLASQAYERLIRQHDGVTLQLLGLGTDGHIGFNEPGSSLASRTRPKALTLRTRQDNARFFKRLEDVPKVSITMGIGTILEAREILLIATGEKKADAVAQMVEGPLCSNMPASALQTHPSTSILIDRLAASKLKRLDYYLHVEEIQNEIETQ